MKITEELLRAHDACPDQIEVFTGLWPDGVEPTLASLEQARDAGLNVAWAACFLSEAAWAEYERVTDETLAKYDRVTDAARAEYERACDEALVTALAAMPEPEA